MPRGYGNSQAIWDHSVTCHLAEMTLLLLPQPIKAGTRFSDPREMQGWVDIEYYLPKIIQTDSLLSDLF